MCKLILSDKKNNDFTSHLNYVIVALLLNKNIIILWRRGAGALLFRRGRGVGMKSWVRSTGLVSVAALGLLLSNASFADECPVGLVNGLTIDAEFGPGSKDVTRCLEKVEKVKVVYQVNQKCKNSACKKPYAIGNMNNAINDYKITHGMDDEDFKLVAVVHSAGWPLILNNNAQNPNTQTNPFQNQVEALLAKGVDIYFCQNTARAKGVKKEQMIPGIQFVTAGVTALADFQLEGYAFIQP